MAQNYAVVSTAAALDQLVDRLRAAGRFSFDLEGTGLDPMSVGIVGLSFSAAEGEAYYVPVGHVGLIQPDQLPIGHVLERIKPLLTDAGLSTLAHNANYDTTLLAENGVEVSNLSFDSMIARAPAQRKIAEPQGPGIREAGRGHDSYNRSDRHRRKAVLTMAQVDITRAADYAAADADMTFRLSGTLGPELRDKGLWSLFADVEMPLISVLVHMQRNGVALNTDSLSEMSTRAWRALRSLEQQVYDAVGHQFNINSPQQLSAVLFQDLKLPAGKKKGVYSTGVEILEELRGEHPVIAPILEYRQWPS